MSLRKVVMMLAGSAMLIASPVGAQLSVSAGAETLHTGSIQADKPAPKAKADAKAKKVKADAPAKKQAKEKVAKAKPAAQPQLASVEGNSKELRSDLQPVGFFQALAGQGPRMLPETEARDQILKQREGKGKKFSVKQEFMPQSVPFSGYRRGTIVIDTKARFLYLVESGSTARRYAIAVGREGLLFTGEAKIQDKQEWPRWIPTKDMQEREPKKYGQYKDGMDGGPDNPLGARAMYLYQGKKDTHIRIHGTNQPWTIGTNSSNGCFRMINEHVMDLYNRVKLGTDVVVL